jgi:rod shape determining protein RodA
MTMSPVRSHAAVRSSPFRRTTSYWRQLDWILIVAAVLASLVGSVLVWSASRSDLASETDTQSFLKKHLLNLAVGLIMCLLVSRLDHRLMRAYLPFFYIASVLLLFVPFLPAPIGTSTGGARAWIALIPGFTIQPSEFAKIAIIVGMALLLSEKQDAESVPSDRAVLLSLGIAALPIGIVLLQNDTGTVLVMCTVVLAIIAVSGARSRWLYGLVLGGLTIALAAVQFGLLKSYQIDRLTSFWDPENSSESATFNVEQARIAIGGGGWFGHGLFQGPQTQGNFVPVNESDFVFTVAGEELGFIGSALILLLLGIVLWRALRIAFRADDLFGRLVATGVVAWLAFQMFENVGMSLGIMPVTGVPLPFVSYGGTSMFATWIAVGLLQSVWIHRKG